MCSDVSTLKNKALVVIHKYLKVVVYMYMYMYLNTKYWSGMNLSIKSGSQYDASLALHQLRCDKILKTDWSNATQLTQR